MLTFALIAMLATLPGGNVYLGTERHLRVDIPRIEASVELDGRLTEPVWSQAARLAGFSQYAPEDGRPARDETEVLVWYSPNAIHFGIRAHAAPGTVRASRSNTRRHRTSFSATSASTRPTTRMRCATIRARACRSLSSRQTERSASPPPWRTRSFRNDWLFSYQPRPGTVLFAGYGNTLANAGTDPLSQDLRRTRDGFFLKLSYLFRM